jgi:hypothetical protein
MIAREQLQLLLDVRRGLLRELDRLDLAILNLRGEERLAGLLETRATERRSALTWEDALHDAKVPLARNATQPS